MKKLTLTIVCALAMTGAAFAQGTVNWAAIPASAMTVQTNSTQFAFGGGLTGGGTVGNIPPVIGGPTFYFELLYNTAFTGSQASVPTYNQLFGGTWLDTGLTATNATVAGRLVPVAPNAVAVVPWARGTTNNIMLVGWSVNLGTSWTTVSNELATQTYGATSGEAFFGESATGFLSPNIGIPEPGATVFGTSASPNGLPIFSLNTQLYEVPATIPTPEPGTIALVGLGGLSLLLFRRRK